MGDETCACSRVKLDRGEGPGMESHRCEDCGSRFMRSALWNPQREATAATILAALIARGAGSPEWYATEAVKLAAALCDELERK